MKVMKIIKNVKILYYMGEEQAKMVLLIESVYIW